jgi:hypothetical protein
MSVPLTGIARSHNASPFNDRPPMIDRGALRLGRGRPPPLAGAEGERRTRRLSMSAPPCRAAIIKDDVAAGGGGARSDRSGR